MSWIKANPLRDPGYFCGRVGCGLCFDWSDDDSGEVQDGVTRIASELLGVPAKQVTHDEYDQVREGLMRAHISVQAAASAWDDAQAAKRIAMQVGAVISQVKENRVNAQAVRKSPGVVIDNMSEKEIEAINSAEKKKQLEEQHRKDQEEARVLAEKEHARDRELARAQFAGMGGFAPSNVQRDTMEQLLRDAAKQSQSAEKYRDYRVQLTEWEKMNLEYEKRKYRK